MQRTRPENHSPEIDNSQQWPQDLGLLLQPLHHAVGPQ
jgi:hypothetical protein